jgi:tetratricopeptide (TPR) repeat protein
MDPVIATLLSTSLGLGLGGATAWNAVRRRWRVEDERQLVAAHADAAHASHQQQVLDDVLLRLDRMESLLNDARSVLPDLDGAILAHRLLTEDHPGLDNLWSALDRMSMAVQVEEDGSLVVDPLRRSMLERLFNAVSSSSGAIEGRLTTESMSRLARLAVSLGEDGVATALVDAALLDRPGDAGLHAVAESIAARRGDASARRRHLEAQLRERPDDTVLLRRQAHLLASAGEADAERPVRRLEALGEVTAADRSLLSGLRARAGSHDEALVEIETALNEDPTRTDDWVRRGELLEADDVDAALASAEACLNLDRQHGAAWALKARCLARLPDRAHEALKSATHAVALDAGGWTMIMLKSELQESIGSFTAAEEGLERAITAHSDDPDLRAAIATRHLERGRLAEAQALLDGAPSGMEHASLHLVEGRLALARADLVRDGTGTLDGARLREAAAAFDEALMLDRENGLAWLAMGRVRRLLGGLDDAGEALTRAGRLLDEHLPALCAESALLALEHGDDIEAERLTDAADIRGEGALIAYVRGNIAARRGRLDTAIAHYDEALRLDPNHVRARLNRCSAYLGGDLPERALEDAERLLQQAPDLLLARLRRAESRMALTDWDGALEDLKVIIEAVPDHHHALTQLAACYVAQDRPERAEAPLNEALRAAPGHAHAWHQRGLLYLQWERLDEAASDFEAAIRCRGDHLDARLHLAATHHMRDDHDAAAAAWRAVLAIDPEHAVARLRLQETEQMLTA